MTDPRAILKAAGVECAEVDEWSGATGPMFPDLDGRERIVRHFADAAILALARIASQLASDKSDCQEAAQRANEAASLANQDNARLGREVAKHERQRDRPPRKRSIWRA